MKVPSTLLLFLLASSTMNVDAGGGYNRQQYANMKPIDYSQNTGIPAMYTVTDMPPEQQVTPESVKCSIDVSNPDYTMVRSKLTPSTVYNKNTIYQMNQRDVIFSNWYVKNQIAYLKSHVKKYFGESCDLYMVEGPLPQNYYNETMSRLAANIFMFEHGAPCFKSKTAKSLAREASEYHNSYIGEVEGMISGMRHAHAINNNFVHEDFVPTEVDVVLFPNECYEQRKLVCINYNMLYKYFTVASREFKHRNKLEEYAPVPSGKHGVIKVYKQNHPDYDT